MWKILFKSAGFNPVFLGTALFVDRIGKRNVVTIWFVFKSFRVETGWNRLQHVVAEVLGSNHKRHMFNFLDV